MERLRPGSTGEDSSKTWNSLIGTPQEGPAIAQLLDGPLCFVAQVPAGDLIDVGAGRLGETGEALKDILGPRSSCQSRMLRKQKVK